MKNKMTKIGLGIATALGSVSAFAAEGVAQSPIENITKLFDLGPLIIFFTSAAAAIVSFQFGKKAFGMVRSWIKKA